jgi:hypothetical protein
MTWRLESKFCQPIVGQSLQICPRSNINHQSSTINHQPPTHHFYFSNILLKSAKDQVLRLNFAAVLRKSKSSSLQIRKLTQAHPTMALPGAAYPPELSPSEAEHLLSTIKDWSIAHGLAVRPPPSIISTEADPHGVLATTAPVTLFPSPFPRICFEQAKSVQKAYNELYAAIAQDEQFLEDIVQEYVPEGWENLSWDRWRDSQPVRARNGVLTDKQSGSLRLMNSLPNYGRFI